MENIKDILVELGYKLYDHGYYYSTSALYRNGDDPGSLTIYPDKGLVIDWVMGTRFSIKELIRVTLGVNDGREVEKWILDKKLRINIEPKELKLEQNQTFPVSWLSELAPNHSYWINRGIKEEILTELKGGIATEKIPRMQGRYCFPIFDVTGKTIIGIQGRSLNGKMPKYKIIGVKSSFLYPLHWNIDEIKKKKQIILLEGIADGLSLSVVGINNWMVLFGVSLSNQQLTKIIEINPTKIIIATNNDIINNAGNIAAQKIQSRLLKFFDKRSVEIKLPHQKDLNLVLMSEGADSLKKMYELD